MASKRDRGELQLVMWSALLEEVRREVRTAIEGQPTGMSRIDKGINALLDGSLRRRPIHELADSLPGNVREEAMDRHLSAALQLLHLELQRVGVADAEEPAFMICEKVCDLAHEEYAARSELPHSRRSLRGWLENLRP